jgi:hypothetical protein
MLKPSTGSGQARFSIREHGLWEPAWPVFMDPDVRQDDVVRRTGWPAIEAAPFLPR